MLSISILQLMVMLVVSYQISILTLHQIKKETLKNNSLNANEKAIKIKEMYDVFIQSRNK